MKIKFIFFCVVTLITTSSFSQRCRYTKDKVDPMTNERIRLCTNLIEDGDNLGAFNYKRTGEKLELVLGVFLNGTRNFILPKGSIVKVKMGDENIYEFKSNKDTEPASFVRDRQVATQYAVYFDCTRSEMEIISKNGFIALSIDINGKNYSYKVSKKRVKHTIKNANCILQE